MRSADATERTTTSPERPLRKYLQSLDETPESRDCRGTVLDDGAIQARDVAQPANPVGGRDYRAGCIEQSSCGDLILSQRANGLVSGQRQAPTVGVIADNGRLRAATALFSP